MAAPLPGIKHTGTARCQCLLGSVLAFVKYRFDFLESSVSSLGVRVRMLVCRLVHIDSSGQCCEIGHKMLTSHCGLPPATLPALDLPCSEPDAATNFLTFYA